MIDLPPLVKDKKPSETTVVAAMSGGVDSSVVAAMLHKLGYKVIGVTLQLWDYTPSDKNSAKGTCCALDDVYDARRVCQTIGIPHYVMNYESEFKQHVVDDFVETYLAGATPIPCVRCNQRIKFASFMDKAKELGADVLVTGHYVRKNEDDNGNPIMLRGIDKNKDQSYFLFTTTLEQLAFSAFPIGNITKDETRKIAQELGLHLHQKSESQDICFVPDGDYRAVVRKYAPDAIKGGNFVDKTGTILGTHDGIINFTVGQRKGLLGGFAKPMYVVEIDGENNNVVLDEKAGLYKSVFTVKEVNWLTEASENEEVLVQVRYGHQAAVAKLENLGGGRYKVTTHEPQLQISPGQAAVFYRGEQLLGGGWIEVPSNTNSPKHAINKKLFA